MLRAILFDFDGTIALSEPLHFAAFSETLVERGVSLPQALYYQRYLGLTDAEGLERMLDDFGRADLHAEAPALLHRKAEIMAQKIAAGVPLCPGVTSFVADAAQRVALAIVSGARRAEIDWVLEHAGLHPFFPLILAAEEIQRGKPDPEGYRIARMRLRERVGGLGPEQCLVVEDSPKGIAAARAAGMRVIALPHTCPVEALRSADRIYASYDEIEWRELESLCR
jgi:HAD superfamily hydrolase (TIGR01509 family)